MLFVLVIGAELKKATIAAEPVVLDTAEATANVVRQLLRAKVPVAVDFEGVDLCRNGELALVLISDGATTWLVDITTMGQAAFEDDGGRLRLLLESKDVLKVGYDGRGDADALHHLHKTGLTPCRRWSRKGRAKRARRRRARALEKESLRTANDSAGPEL